MVVVKVLQEFESECKVCQFMEDVCDEFVCEIGDDKQEREEFKCELERVWDEFEEEWCML